MATLSSAVTIERRESRIFNYINFICATDLLIEQVGDAAFLASLVPVSRQTLTWRIAMVCRNFVNVCCMLQRNI